MFWNILVSASHSRQVHFCLKRVNPLTVLNSWQIEVKGRLVISATENRKSCHVFPRRGFTWLSYNSSGVVADSIVVHAGGNMGFLEMMGDGGHLYRNVSIVRKTRKSRTNGTQCRWFSFKLCESRPTLENSESFLSLGTTI